MIPIDAAIKLLKKKDKASKLRQKIDDHEEDSSIIDFYRQNHPEWFDSFRGGEGE